MLSEISFIVVWRLAKYRCMTHIRIAVSIIDVAYQNSVGTDFIGSITVLIESIVVVFQR